jgi:HEAT repeat protein
MSAASLFRLSVGLSLIGSLTLLAAAPEPADPDAAYAERLLKDAKIAVDGPGLLAYFRSHTLSLTDQERLAGFVKQLGDDSFDVREEASQELVRTGRPAIPFLKGAVGDPDIEVSRRAQQCLDAIQQNPTQNLLASAALLLKDRQPAGAAEALLNYLPVADEESVVEAVLDALRVVGLKDGKPDPAVVRALGDKLAMRRLAAARVLGNSGSPEVAKRARVLLGDPDPRVRFEAGVALVRAGEREGVVALLPLLGEGPLPLAWQSEDVLCRIAGEKAPPVTLGTGSEAERKKASESWDRWWRDNGTGVDLTRLKLEDPQLGLTLVCEYDMTDENGRVCELGKDGKVRWAVGNLQGTNDVQLLPGGRVLVAERNGSRVTERDRKGNILWQYHAPGSPISCQRLPSGNTLVATFGELLEVTPDGKVARQHKHPSGFRHAVRLRNGNVLYISSNGQVVELDPDFKQVRTVTPENFTSGAGYWASVELLPTGRYLLALGGASKVVEIDQAGKILWQCDVPHAVYATRLRNGNTLVASFENRYLVEMDRTGKEVNKITVQGRPFTIRRY